MINAINQTYFVPELLYLPTLHWIKQRKIVYIPKKSNPKKPGDFRPLSMLETFYKIPSRIIANRISLALPEIIGQHQYGFMKGRGIQDPIILALSALQDAIKTGKPLQILAFDLEKAFDKTGHGIIKDAMNKFGFPPLATELITKLTLQGQAYVEVNGYKSDYFDIKTVNATYAAIDFKTQKNGFWPQLHPPICCTDRC